MDMFHWLRRRPYLTAALDVVDCVIFPSRAIAQQIAPALNHDRWQVMPNGLPASCFRDRPTATAGRREPATLTLGYAGALLPHKAPHLLFEAVRRLGWHRTRVRLAGPPGERPYEAQLRRDAAGLNVEFCGRIEPERMPDFFASLDLVVVPSVWPENFPYAVLEAHAAGVPVLASRIGGLVEQVEDPSLLFEPGSAEGLAACLAAWAQRDEPPALPVVAKADDLAEKIVHIYAQAAARYDQANHLAGGSGGL